VQASATKRESLFRSEPVAKVPAQSIPGQAMNSPTAQAQLKVPSKTPTAQQPEASPTRQSMAGLRLRKHADYQQAYALSRKHQSASMSWFLALRQPADEGFSRIGLTAGKVMGKAHERNRLKRRMREALRRHTELLPAGCDLIFHPRRKVLDMDFRKLESEVVRILEQARGEATAKAKGEVAG